MKKIVKFLNKQQQFEKWLDDVKKENFKEAPPSALIIWEVSNKLGYTAMHTNYNCDLDTLRWFHRSLGEKIKQLEFDKFMREHINEYIEYIE